MRAMLRKFLIAFVVLVLLVAGAMFWLRGSLDGLVKDGVEHFGSAMTGASVTVGSVELHTTDGHGIIRDLVIGNPPGYKTAHALRVGKIDVVVDVGTLANDVITIRKIDIVAPDVSYEKGDAMTNFDAIQKNIADYLGPSKPDDKGGKKLIVEQLLIRDAKAEASAPILAGKTVAVPLPDIALNNIGKAKGGVTPGELGQTIAAALKQKLTAGFSFDRIGKGLEQVGGAIGGLFK
jgi:hypothetical protein